VPAELLENELAALFALPGPTEPLGSELAAVLLLLGPAEPLANELVGTLVLMLASMTELVATELVTTVELMAVLAEAEVAVLLPSFDELDWPWLLTWPLPMDGAC